MATLSSPSPPPARRRRKSWARKCERCCWTAVIHFPLVFVYGLSTWAVWVVSGIGLESGPRSTAGIFHLPNFIIASLTYISCRVFILHSGHPSLHPLELVVHRGCIHRSRLSTHILLLFLIYFSFDYGRRVQPPSNARNFLPIHLNGRSSPFVHGKINRRSTFLQEVSSPQTRSRASLFDV